MQVGLWRTGLGASPEVDGSRPAPAHSDGAVGVGGVRRLLTQRRLQVILGLIWLLDAGLQFQPYMFSRGFVANFLAMNDMFQPHVIAVAIESITEFLVPHAAAWNVLFATTQLAVGVGLLFRRTVKPALLLSFGWVLGVWVVGEGLGGLLTPIMGSPLAGFPGPVLIYGLVGLVLWPTRHLERETVASAGALGARGTRVLWAVLWFGMSIEQLRPAPGLSPSSVMKVIVSMNEPGEPTWLVHLDKVATTSISSIGSPLVLVLALVEVTIGVLVLRGHQVKAALWAAIVLSSLFWVVGQDFGGILAGHATDPSAGPLYVLLAFSLYPVGSNRQGEEASEATAAAPAETAPTPAELTA